MTFQQTAGRELSPRSIPYRLITVLVYSEQVGSKRQAGQGTARSNIDSRQAQGGSPGAR